MSSLGFSFPCPSSAVGVCSDRLLHRHMSRRELNGASALGFANIVLSRHLKIEFKDFLSMAFFSSRFHKQSVALGVEVGNKVPGHEYYGYFGPDFTLHVAPSNMENKNSQKLLNDIRSKVLKTLSRL